MNVAYITQSRNTKGVSSKGEVGIGSEDEETHTLFGTSL